MNADQLRDALERVRDGRLDVAEALSRMSPAVAELDFATVDLDRGRRCGFPEVVFAEGKTAAWVEGVVRKLAEAGQDCFATRVSPEQADHLAARFPNAQQDRIARTFWMPTTAERATRAARSSSSRPAPATCRWPARRSSRPPSSARGPA